MRNERFSGRIPKNHVTAVQSHMPFARYNRELFTHSQNLPKKLPPFLDRFHMICKEV